MSQYGNPHSRTHAYGWESEAAMELARKVDGFVNLIFNYGSKKLMFHTTASLRICVVVQENLKFVGLHLEVVPSDFDQVILEQHTHTTTVISRGLMQRVPFLSSD